MKDLKKILLGFTALALVRADEVIYTDNGLAPGWEDWSWGSTINYDATAVAEGTSSIFVNSTEYSALSLENPVAFNNTFAGLAFDISVVYPNFYFSWIGPSYFDRVINLT